MPFSPEQYQAYQNYRDQSASPQNTPYGQGQFTGTPYNDIYNMFANQWQGAVRRGDQSQTSESGRQLDDLYRFMTIMGGGPGEYFNIAQRNLGQQMGNQVGQAQQNAAALAGSRGLANPSASILGAGTSVRQQYAPVQGQLEAGRAQAQQQFLAQLLQYLTGQGQQRAQRNAEIESQTPNALDWISGLTPIALAPFTGGASLAAYAGKGSGGSGGGSSPFSSRWNPNQYIDPNNAINRPLPWR